MDPHVDLLLFEFRLLTLPFEVLEELGHRCFSRSALLRRRLADIRAAEVGPFARRS